MIDVTANNDCDILFINVSKLFEACPKCDSNHRLIQNLVLIGAQKTYSFQSTAFIQHPKQYGDDLCPIFGANYCTGQQ